MTFISLCILRNHAEHELVDYLMFKYLVEHSEVSPPRLPAIGGPMVPAVTKTERPQSVREDSQSISNQEFK